jgi:pimeloyl-ACP methyl ester carboxylesterase
MKRRLLFLPGAGADPDFWKPIGNLLPDSWEKIYFAWPGLGQQKSIPSVRCLDDLVTIVEILLGDSPVDLLAQSMGGRIALRILLKHPEQVRRVVFSATGVGLDLSKFCGADWKSDYLKKYPQSAHWFNNDNIDFTNELPKITHPTLILCGDADAICPIAVGERLLQLLPNSKLEIVRGGDHSFVRERPDQIISAIMNHLE